MKDFLEEHKLYLPHKLKISFQSSATTNPQSANLSFSLKSSRRKISKAKKNRPSTELFQFRSLHDFGALDSDFQSPPESPTLKRKGFSDIDENYRSQGFLTLDLDQKTKNSDLLST